MDRSNGTDVELTVLPDAVINQCQIRENRFWNRQVGLTGTATVTRTILLSYVLNTYSSGGSDSGEDSEFSVIRARCRNTEQDSFSGLLESISECKAGQSTTVSNCKASSSSEPKSFVKCVHDRERVHSSLMGSPIFLTETSSQEANEVS